MLSHSQTRQKLKEAYDAEFLATIERAEKQIILAKHGRRLLVLLDDSPVVPGDTRPAYDQTQQARQILNDAEDDLRDWQPEVDEYTTLAVKRSSSGNLRPKESMIQEESGQQHDGASVTGTNGHTNGEKEVVAA
jgi:hypothetical protein